MSGSTHSQTPPGDVLSDRPTGTVPEVMSQGAEAIMADAVLDEMAMADEVDVGAVEHPNVQLVVPLAGPAVTQLPAVNAVDVAAARRARDRERQRLNLSRESEAEHTTRQRRNRDSLRAAPALDREPDQLIRAEQRNTGTVMDVDRPDRGAASDAAHSPDEANTDGAGDAAAPRPAAADVDVNADEVDVVVGEATLAGDHTGSGGRRGRSFVSS